MLRVSLLVCFIGSSAFVLTKTEGEEKKGEEKTEKSNAQHFQNLRMIRIGSSSICLKFPRNLSPSEYTFLMQNTQIPNTYVTLPQATITYHH